MKDTPTNPIDEMIAGLEELAVALESGAELSPQFNCYQLTLDLKPHTYKPSDVKAVRKQLRASQAVFAKYLGVARKTVSQWEQGVSPPKPIACRFMDEISGNIAHHLDQLQKALRKKTTTEAGC